MCPLLSRENMTDLQLADTHGGCDPSLFPPYGAKSKYPTNVCFCQLGIAMLLSMTCYLPSLSVPICVVLDDANDPRITGSIRTNGANF